MFSDSLLSPLHLAHKRQQICYLLAVVSDKLAQTFCGSNATWNPASQAPGLEILDGLSPPRRLVVKDFNIPISTALEDIPKPGWGKYLYIAFPRTKTIMRGEF